MTDENMTVDDEMIVSDVYDITDNKLRELDERLSKAEAMIAAVNVRHELDVEHSSMMRESNKQLYTSSLVALAVMFCCVVIVMVILHVL